MSTLERAQRTEPGLEELRVIARTYAQSKELRRFLGSPSIGPEEKEGLLDRLWSGAVGMETMALLHLLLRWDRVDHLPELFAEAQKVAEQRQGILRGVVTTAHPISSAELGRVAQAVGQKMGRRVLLERRVDPKVLGGARVEVGTTLLDGSVRAQLGRVREQLLAVKVNS